MTERPYSPDREAVLHILTSPLLETRAAPFLDDHDVDWEGLLAAAETMSGGEHLLVRVAYDLSQAQGVVGIWEIPRRLGPSGFERVLDALRISHGYADTEAAEGVREAA